VLTLNAAGAFD